MLSSKLSTTRLLAAIHDLRSEAGGCATRVGDSPRFQPGAIKAGAGPDAATLLLARAASPEQEAFIGNQAGGRVFLFLKTGDFDRDYAAYRARGVRFVRPPAEHAYGKVAVFEDLYGNRWDLVQFAAGR